MSKNKKVVLYTAIFALIVAAILVASPAGATEELPYDTYSSNVVGFEIPSGQYCVVAYQDGEPFDMQCFCPCEAEQVATSSTEVIVEEKIVEVEVIKEVPGDCDDCPVCEDCPDPDPCPTQEPCEECEKCKKCELCDDDDDCDDD